MTTGVVGAGYVLPAGTPFETQTMTFPIVLPLPRTRASLGTGAECFFAQAGSPSMASGRSVGAFPSNVTVPVMFEAPSAMPGQNAAVTNPAASHSLFPVTRIVGSLSSATLVASLSTTLATRPMLSGPTLHPACWQVQ